MKYEELKTLEAAFKQDCTVLFMAHEYPGYVGEIKCMLLTDLSEQELKEKYKPLLREYTPYQLAPASLAEPVADYNRNEDKFAKRACRNTGFFELDEEAECMHHELQEPDFAETIFEQMNQEYEKECVMVAFSRLTPYQQKTVHRYVLAGKTLREIAAEDGCSYIAVKRCLQRALKQMKKFLVPRLTNGTPLSKHNEGVNQVSGAAASSTFED